ncbi:MAG: hypothetical protein IKT41_05455 [Clostridia bacterium]|nr:hypothetical protein [Clostridia bacterium]
MKKLTTIAIITLMSICLLAGCTSQKEAIHDTEALTPVVVPFDKEEVEIRDLYLKLYAEKQEAENFISDEDAAIYEEYNLYIRNREVGFITSYNELYNETREYYYPIILSDKDEVVIAYTDEYGKLCVYNASKDSHDYFRNIHVLEGTEFIDNCANYSIVYTGNSVQAWDHCKLVAETTVPTDSIYTGFSYWEGYIFRNNGDIYSVQLEKQEEKFTLTSEAIAHKVKEVISTDYELNSDAWSQPLFLMKDGTVKAYCIWHGDKDAPRDDVCHLSAPQYEGGYK